MLHVSVACETSMLSCNAPRRSVSGNIGEESKISSAFNSIRLSLSGQEKRGWYLAFRTPRRDCGHRARQRILNVPKSWIRCHAIRPSRQLKDTTSNAIGGLVKLEYLSRRRFESRNL